MSVIPRVVESRPLGLPVRNVQSPVTEVSLQVGELWRMRGDNRWCMIVCLQGEIWITQARDIRDYVLTAGETFIITQSGLVLVKAFQPSSIQVTASLKSVPYVGNYVAFS